MSWKYTRGFTDVRRLEILFGYWCIERAHAELKNSMSPVSAQEDLQTQGRLEILFGIRCTERAHAELE